jgi:YYY domain-containing protein
MGKKPVKTIKRAKTRNSMLGVWILFGVIILTALSMRLYQPDWYNDRQFHPDERWIVGSAVPQIKFWGDKPIGLQYGSLPLYILATYNGVARSIQSIPVFQRMDMNRVLIGGARAISGLVDTGTIVFIFLSCLLIFSPSVALLASALLAFTTLHLHASHFFTVDTFVTFFAAGSVYFALRIFKFGTLINYILAGAFYGMAIASKSAALPFAAAIVAAQLFRFFSIKGNSKADKQKRIDAWVNLAWAALSAFVVFFICMPHALLDFDQFMRDQNEQRRILITGEADVPYNRQYLNTVPYLFYLKNLVLYTMGIPYGIVALTAFFFYIAAFFKNLKDGKIPSKETAIILSGVVPYFLIVGVSFAKFNRYMIPFTPFLAILAAKFLFDIYGYVKNKAAGKALIIVTLLGAMFYGVAFMNVYTNSHSWISASRWMFSNIQTLTQVAGEKAPHKTRVLNEMWGDDLPVWVDGKGGEQFDNLKWALQEPDSPNKIEELSNMLSYTDYVVMADKRAYGTYQRLPQKYPLNYFYYSNMIKNPEMFGYKKVFDKVNYPSLFGIDIKDDKADESFQLYDHPRVYIFKNSGYFKKEQIKDMLINGERTVQSANSPFAARQNGNMANAAVKRKDLNNPNIGLVKDRPIAVIPQLSIFFWYALIQLLAFMALPLCFKVFKNLKDKGYGFSKVAGLFLFAWINWIFVSMNVWKFYQVNLWLLIAALFAAAYYFTMQNKKEIAGFAAQNKKYVIVTESIFLGAYLLFVVIKLFCPDIHNVMGQGYNGGGEPMGMAYLSAIYNDVKFPPHDPWMSGFTLNYYYWGQLMLATVSKVLGYAPKLTYDLSLSILFALSFVAAFSLSYNMTGKYKYGVIGGFLLACAGNFHTLYFIFDKIVNARTIQNMIQGVMSFQFIWDPTRIYPSPVITEMPFFSYLYGDLHAHNIVIPVTVVAIGLLYNLMKTQNRTLSFINNFGETKTEIALNAGMISVVLGSMLAINTWNFPPMLILLMLVLFMLALMLYKGNLKAISKLKPEFKAKAIGTFAAEFALSAVVILAAAYAAFMPFHLYFQTPFKAAVGVVSRQEQASLFMMFEYFALFFTVAFAFVFLFWMGGFEKIAAKTGLLKFKMKKFNITKLTAHIEKVFDKIISDRSLTAKTSVFVAGLLIFAVLLLIQPTFAFIFVMMATAAWMLIFSSDRDEVFALLLLFTALGIILGSEIFYIADGRMNTVFKFYMVAWTLLACCVPYLLYRIVQAGKKAFVVKKQDTMVFSLAVAAMLIAELALMFTDARTGSGLFKALFIAIVIIAPAMYAILKDRIGKYVFVSGLLFLTVPAALYPVIGAATKAGMCSLNPGRDFTIDGTAYMKNLTPRPGAVTDFDKYDYQAIEWINNNIRRIDPILEAPGERMYSGVSRISIFTGMPSFIGWGYQVSQQSGREDVPSRTNAANYMYTNNSNPQSLLDTLHQYGIKYIYVGGIERSAYPDTQKFIQVGDIVYTNDGTVIYKVK